MTEGLLVDAKIATPEHLRFSLEKDGSDWEDLGWMDQAQRPNLTAEQKQQYKDQIEALRTQAATNRARYART